MMMDSFHNVCNIFIKRKKNKYSKFIMAGMIGLLCLVGTGCLSVKSGQNQVKAKQPAEVTAGQNAAEQAELQKQQEELAKEKLLNEKIQQKLSEMTIRDKIAQMLIVSPEALVGGSGVTVSDASMKEALQNIPVGGLIYFKGNLVSKAQTTKMIADAQSYAKTGLFISTDEEGGRVTRLMNTVGTTKVGPMFSYRNQGTEKAKANAKTIATDMATLGFNLDFAPDADVWSNPENTVIGNRAYSDDFVQAAELIPAAVEGFHEGGVLCTLKHFPGHGDTLADTHKMSAYVTKTKAELEEQEFLPFQAGIAAGADFVMVGHLIIEDIDSVPATLSTEITTGILRNELGFDGVIITDSLKMNAMKNYYTAEEMSVMAVKAGNDILLDVDDVQTTINAIMDAMARGEITETRINESVERILRVKYQYGVMK